MPRAASGQRAWSGRYPMLGGGGSATRLWPSKRACKRQGPVKRLRDARRPTSGGLLAGRGTVHTQARPPGARRPGRWPVLEVAGLALPPSGHSTWHPGLVRGSTEFGSQSQNTISKPADRNADARGREIREGLPRGRADREHDDISWHAARRSSRSRERPLLWARGDRPHQGRTLAQVLNGRGLPGHSP